MFEARLDQAAVLKKVVEAMKDLVTDANFECTATGMAMQAMDSSHVSLCALLLRSSAFEHFRCDRSLSLGLNLVNLSKILKCAGNDDTMTLKAEDEGDSMALVFENNSQDRISDFELKLMQIDSEHLGIPDTEYKCSVTLSSSEFQRIIRDLGVLGDTCVISCNKEGVKFSVSGDMGTGNITLKENGAVDEKEDKKSVSCTINMEEPVELQFAIRYLNFFCKATPLSDTVKLSMSADVPLVVEYSLEEGQVGYVRYYLAPKIDEEA